MKRTLMVLGVVAVCLPMLFMGWLVLASHWEKIDAVTARLPEGARSLVVQVMLAKSKDAKSLERGIKLDAQAVREWEQQDVATGLIVKDQQTPEHFQALYKQQVEDRKVAQALSQRADEQRKAGHACAAEDLYTAAAGKDMSQELYQYSEGVGRAGLECGDLPGARAGLEAAILKQTDFIKGTEEDQLTSVRRDLLKDREFLVVVYVRQHENALATTVCSQAHPDWKGCACSLESKGDVKCQEAQR